MPGTVVGRLRDSWHLVGRLRDSWHLVALVGLLLLFVVVAARSAGRPFLFDEANFLFQARAIAETGVPHANMGYMGDRGQVTTRENYGLWHPPLYLYLLGLTIKLFGSAEPAVRGLGIALMLPTALVVYGLGHTVAGGGPRGRGGGLLAVALFLASPLVVQSAALVDIDGTVLLLTVSAWVLLYLRWQHTTALWRLVALGGLLALALWAKLTTPLALVGVVALYQALAGRPWLGLRQAAVILGTGLPLFLATWWLVAALTRMPFEMPFQFTAWQFLDASHNTRGWLGDAARMRAELAPPLVWVSPYLVGAFGALVLVRAAAWVRTRRAEPVDLLLLVGGLIFAAYFMKLAANFPKYHVGMLPFWMAALSWWLVGWLAALDRRGRLLAAGAGAAVVGASLWDVGDAWMWRPALVWEPAVMVPSLLLFVGAAVLAVLAGARGAAARARLAVPAGALVGALVVLFVGWGLAVNGAQARADYSTSYYYGTRGQREAAALLDSLGYDGAWVGAKEVAWYAHNQTYIDADTFWWLVIAQGLEFDGAVLGHDVAVVVPWTTDAEVRDFFWRQLHRRYDQVGEVADYTVWVRRDARADMAQVAARASPAGR